MASALNFIPNSTPFAYGLESLVKPVAFKTLDEMFHKLGVS